MKSFNFTNIEQFLLTCITNVGTKPKCISKR